MKPRKPLPRSTKPIKRSRLPSRSRKVRTKPRPRVCEAFREWIREQPCFLSGFYWEPYHGCRGTVQCCHVKTRGSGGADVGNCFPACALLHAVQHQLGIKTFQETYGISLAGVAREHTERWLSTEDGQKWQAEHPE